MCAANHWGPAGLRPSAQPALGTDLKQDGLQEGRWLEVNTGQGAKRPCSHSPGSWEHCRDAQQGLGEANRLPVGSGSSAESAGMCRIR